MSSSNRSDGSSSSSSRAMNPLSPFGHSMSHHMLVNLDSDNFLLWRLLIHPFVRGNRLDIILIGTEKCPNQVDKATGEPDPKFTSVVPSSIDTSFSVVPFPIFSIRNNVGLSSPDAEVGPDWSPKGTRAFVLSLSSRMFCPRAKREMGLLPMVPPSHRGIGTS
ncbi:hypothetical protein Syun_025133 [Stephania yunnanensis]|uniref:Retrotransposon Copia-like N-terminal domain-containing protein n=1 Tax=Stephania yunnanensis TaxID=152371 RepID=A0AAP0EWM7_9MAGN